MKRNRWFWRRAKNKWRKQRQSWYIRVFLPQMAAHYAEMERLHTRVYDQFLSPEDEVRVRDYLNRIYCVF